MKKVIHPTMHPVVFVDGQHQIISMSTKTSDKTVDIDGVQHYVISIDVSSYTHPLYTGEKRFLDTLGQVGRFQEKQKKAQAFRKNLEQKKGKIEVRKQERTKSLKDLLLEV